MDTTIDVNDKNILLELQQNMDKRNRISDKMTLVLGKKVRYVLFCINGSPSKLPDGIYLYSFRGNDHNGDLCGLAKGGCINNNGDILFTDPDLLDNYNGISAIIYDWEDVEVSQPITEIVKFTDEEFAGTSFSYDKIDSIPDSFLEGVMVKGKMPKMPKTVFEVPVGKATIKVEVDLNRNVTSLNKWFGGCISNHSLPEDWTYYDPIDAEIIFELPKGCEKDVSFARELTAEQIRTRALVFMKTLQTVYSEDGARAIAEAAAKKKDGTLVVKRILPISTIFCQRRDIQMYELFAKATGPDGLPVSCRLVFEKSYKKICKDLIQSNNLFR